VDRGSTRREILVVLAPQQVDDPYNNDNGSDQPTPRYPQLIVPVASHDNGPLLEYNSRTWRIVLGATRTTEVYAYPRGNSEI
jgi:hypothetical protein